MHIPIPLTFDTFYGLWLNVPRLRFQFASMILAGTAAAGHNKDLDPIWADALARFPEEVDELLFQINAARWTADAQSRGAFG